MGFLKKVIDLALSTLPHGQLSNSLFLFPSKRAILFFTQALKENTHRPDPLLMPPMATLSDWVIRIGGWQMASDETLLITLFRSYCLLAGDFAQSFEQFFPQSQTILADLLEIDKARLKPDEVRNISTNALSSDTPNSQFSRILKLLPALHEQFSQELLAQKQLHYPLALRTLLERKESIQESIKGYEAVFLCGFYPIDLAETEFFARMGKLPQVFSVWDDDLYFTECKGQEAGLLFKNPQLFPKAYQPEDDSLRSRARTITLIETQGSVAQAKAIGSLLEQLGREDGQTETDTALILPHEQLLLPLLSAVPSQLEHINITMGYPLSQSLIASLFRCIEMLHRQTPASGAAVPFKALHGLLTHPEWLPLLGTTTLEKLYTAQTNRTRTVERSEAESFLGKAAFLLVPPSSAEALCLMLLSFLEQFKDAIGDESPPHKLELLNQIRRQVLALGRLTEAKDLQITVQTAWRIFLDKLEETSLHFSGEPLQGLQVMGMLETRCLNFKNLIFLSFNEGVYPQGKGSFSLIPNELKQQYQMAGHKEHEALQAYYFYRLLKRCERVWLLYDGSGRGERGAEASRFIRQIEHELVRNSPGTQLIRQPIIQPPPPLHEAQPLSVVNNEQLRLRWQEMKFSASAINAHNSCPLKFFYRYGLKIKEPSQYSDVIDPLGIGLITHHCLQELYKPFVGKIIDAAAIHSMRDRVKSKVSESSHFYYPGLDISRGRPYLESQVLIELLHQILSAQSDEAPYHLNAIEKEFQGRFRLKGGSEFLITGIFDRIDQTDSTWRIVDYKSGQVDSSDVKTDKMPTRFDIDDPFNHKNIAWQLLIYQWLFCKQTRLAANEVDCAVLSLRSPQSGFMYLSPTESSEAVLSDFSILLEDFFTTLNDPAYIFKQTEKPESCSFCPYKEICHR